MILEKFFEFVISVMWRNFVVVFEMMFFVMVFFGRIEVFELYVLLVICLMFFVLILLFNLVGNVLVCVVVRKMCKL